MAQITVHAARQRVIDGWPAVVACIEIEGQDRTIYFRSSRGPLTASCDPFVAVALLPAMRLNQPLLVQGALSRRLLTNIVTLQDTLCSWYPAEMHRVEVRADHVAEAPVSAPRRVGSFFSGGIDSFHNAIKHSAEIDDLIFIHGFDIRLSEQAKRALVSNRLRQAATEMNKNMLEVETNLRNVLNLYTDWNLHSHGSALGAVALALAPQFRRIYIGATHAHEELRFHGSHPLLDPLWGNETLEIVHDGCELSRWRKAEQVVRDPVARRYLRTCYVGGRAEYNCGQCQNCMMTMILLRAIGMAEQCPTFPALDLQQVAQAVIPGSPRRQYYDVLLEMAEERGTDAELIAALRQRLARAEADGIAPYVHSPELRRLEARVAGLRTDLARVKGQMNEMKHSRSWRVTRTLRAGARLARRIAAAVRDKG